MKGRLAQGATRAEIAAELGVKPGAVDAKARRPGLQGRCAPGCNGAQASPISPRSSCAIGPAIAGHGFLDRY